MNCMKFSHLQSNIKIYFLGSGNNKIQVTYFKGSSEDLLTCKQLLTPQIYKNFRIVQAAANRISQK